jgi:hypothetical protein
MSTIRITCAWDDNTLGDVDYIAQELTRVCLQVKIDHWNIRAGRRLWEQIENIIQKENESDAWLMYATQKSLGSEVRREEYSDAIERTLSRRGDDFPIIALFPGPIDHSLIPITIRTLVYVSLTDLEWIERIKVAAERRSASTARTHLEPFTVQIYRNDPAAGQGLAIEVRPRAGTWSPFFAAVPLSEKDRVQPQIILGPHDRVPQDSVLIDTGEAPSSDNGWWVMFARNEATPIQSYYIRCVELPSRLAFGVNGGRPQFIVSDLQLYPWKFS